MSDDTTLSTAAENLQETIDRTVDASEVESLLTSEESSRSAGRQLGRRVGREIGAIIGREIGAVVAVDVRDQKGPRAILADVKRRFVELLNELVRDADLESLLSQVVDRGSALLRGEPAEGLLGIGGISEDGAGGDGEQASESEDDEEAEEEELDVLEAAEEWSAVDEEAVSDLSVDDLKELRTETYRELLEVMSYRDLQSVAKEVDVKANLSQDEMVDRIVETFSEETEQ